MKILGSSISASAITILLILVPLPSNASIACSSHDQCPVGSLCGDGRCSNPFVKGCLHTMAARKGGHGDGTTIFKPRVCNSDDHADGGSSDNCVKKAEFPYKEVRISPANWDSSVMQGFVYQILLSEVFRVPTTIEMGDGKRQQEGSFYDTESRHAYPRQSYPLEQLIEADRVDGDCSLSDKPCGLLFPEATWEKAEQISILDKNMNILPPESNGVIGEIGFFIPAHTAKKNVEFLSFYGLSGDDSRIKLANTFKEPTTWRDYCEHVDPTNCTVLDKTSTSKRYPDTTEEKDSYFMPDLYTGHFRVTDRSNCTLNRDTCTGNVIAPPCDSWTTYVENQMHWNNISLTSNGKIEPNNGYSYTHMLQVWKAANATKSDVCMWWWTPDIMVDEYKGSDYAFHRVTLPEPTEECNRYHALELNAVKCSADAEVRRGDAVGACDYDAGSWHKVMSRGLKSSSLPEGVEEALRSPAYDFLDKFAFPPYALPTIFQQWIRLMGENGMVYDNGYAARESVCEFVYDNYEKLMRRNPRGFPREKKTENYSSLSYTGYVLGSIALVVAIAAAICLYIWRDHKVIKNSQLDVLIAMIAGYILAGLSAVLHAVVETTDDVCTLQQWTLRLCYCLEFIPIMIKISSINKLGREARLFRKVQIDSKRFKKQLAFAIFVLVAYLTIWTAVDMPKKTDDFKILEGEVTTTVEFYSGCASFSPVWEVVPLGFEGFVLLSASVLAYQSREIIEKLDESNWLAFLVYTHSVFLLIRVVDMVLAISGAITASMSTKIMGIVVALETIACILVYFLPKFVRIKSKKALREIPVQLRGSTTNKGKGGKTYITGITIPEGGIPNLIKKRPDATSRRTSADSDFFDLTPTRRASTPRKTSADFDSYDLTSTRRVSTSEGPDAKTAKTSIPVDAALSIGRDSRNADIEILRSDIDRLTRENYEHKRRRRMETSSSASLVCDPDKKRSSMDSLAS